MFDVWSDPVLQLSNVYPTEYLTLLLCLCQDVTLHIQLERVGHYQIWEEKYTDLFYALGFKKVHTNDKNSSKTSSSIISTTAVLSS